MIPDKQSSGSSAKATGDSNGSQMQEAQIDSDEKPNRWSFSDLTSYVMCFIIVVSRCNEDPRVMAYCAITFDGTRGTLRCKQSRVYWLRDEREDSSCSIDLDRFLSSRRIQYTRRLS